MKTKNTFFLVIILLTSACSASDKSSDSVEEKTPIASIVLPTETPIPLTKTPAPVPTAIPLERAQYGIYATLDYAGKKVEVEESILYPNKSTETLSDILLAVEPNLWANGFLLHELSVDSVPINYSLEGQRMHIPLNEPFEPNKNIEIKLRYTLNLPFAEQGDPSLVRARIYGYTDRQVNLTNWYPFVVPRKDSVWQLPNPWYFGEHFIYDAADYDVHFSVNDETVVVAASAKAETTAQGWAYQLKSARAFVLSASPDYKVLSQEVGDVTVYSYYYLLFDIPAQEVLNVSVKALQLYEQIYGEYSHKSLTAVQGDFNDGMEYSGFYFQSNGFYNTYDGTAQNYLTFVSAHEVAHQWFFESVANDQANEPWLDEMLATYSERLYYETYHPEALNWWWQARMFDYSPNAWLDLAVSENPSERAYWSSSYFHGAHFLEELRTRIGDEAFFAFLYDYHLELTEKIATGDDFFRILREHTDVDFSDITVRYFRAAR
ncbi:MAG: hypothetical protein HN392_07745 [Anaerolineae bacterium]|jgi:hypothetical protein|nr:hypothetical protein [Anaerolineae bacterium]MBT7074164.1 hypothetical protein [Anaerolineae bacterium]MBT7783014.1 hypothetical protein [Anaerolineae bacterium]